MASDAMSCGVDNARRRKTTDRAKRTYIRMYIPLIDSEPGQSCTKDVKYANVCTYLNIGACRRMSYPRTTTYNRHMASLPVAWIWEPSIQRGHDHLHVCSLHVWWEDAGRFGERQAMGKSACDVQPSIVLQPRRFISLCGWTDEEANSALAETTERYLIRFPTCGRPSPKNKINTPKKSSAVLRSSGGAASTDLLLHVDA